MCRSCKSPRIVSNNYLKAGCIRQRDVQTNLLIKTPSLKRDGFPMGNRQDTPCPVRPFLVLGGVSSLDPMLPMRPQKGRSMKQPSNHGVTQRINPLTTSFEQLKGMVASTTGKKIPSAKALREGGTDILFVHEHDDCSITVYTNGFYIYKSYGRETVFAVDRCKEIHYQYLNDEVCTVFEHELTDGPCLVPLLLNGDTRIVHNMDSYEWYWYEFSLNDNKNPWAEETLIQGPENELINREYQNQVENALNTLSKQQRRIVHLYYFENLNQSQIAADLGLTQADVSMALSKSKQILRNYKYYLNHLYLQFVN